MVDLLTRIYAGSFEHIYVFSPSVHLDSVWTVVKYYVHKIMGIQEECFCFESDEEKLEEILSTQRVVVKNQKTEKASKRMDGIAVTVDDFARLTLGYE